MALLDLLFSFCNFDLENLFAVSPFAGYVYSRTLSVFVVEHRHSVPTKRTFDLYSFRSIHRRCFCGVLRLRRLRSSMQLKVPPILPIPLLVLVRRVLLSFFVRSSFAPLTFSGIFGWFCNP